MLVTYCAVAQPDLIAGSWLPTRCVLHRTSRDKSIHRDVALMQFDQETRSARCRNRPRRNLKSRSPGVARSGRRPDLRSINGIHSARLFWACPEPRPQRLFPTCSNTKRQGYSRISAKIGGQRRSLRSDAGRVQRRSSRPLPTPAKHTGTASDGSVSRGLTGVGAPRNTAAARSLESPVRSRIRRGAVNPSEEGDQIRQRDGVRSSSRRL